MFSQKRRRQSCPTSSPWLALLRASTLLAVLAVLCAQHAFGAGTDHASAAAEAATDVVGGSGVPASIAGEVEPDALEKVQGTYMYNLAELETGPGAEVKHADKDTAPPWYADGSGWSFQEIQTDPNDAHSSVLTSGTRMLTQAQRCAP